MILNKATLLPIQDPVKPQMEFLLQSASLKPSDVLPSPGTVVTEGGNVHSLSTLLGSRYGFATSTKKSW